MLAETTHIISEGILKIWEVAQRKDLTSSSQNRRAFMVHFYLIFHIHRFILLKL